MQTEHFSVTGMTCGGCSSAVSRALSAVAGVIDSDVSLNTGAVVVQYDEHATTAEQLASAIERAGYGVGTTTQAEPVPKRKGCCCRSADSKVETGTRSVQ